MRARFHPRVLAQMPVCLHDEYWGLCVEQGESWVACGKGFPVQLWWVGRFMKAEIDARLRVVLFVVVLKLYVFILMLLGTVPSVVLTMIPKSPPSLCP